MRLGFSWLAAAIVGLTGCPGGGGPSAQAVDEWLARDGDLSAAARPGAEAAVGPPRAAVATRLAVTIEGAEGLPDTDDGPGVTDPYVIVEYEGYRFETSVVEGSQAPIWGDSFVFDLHPGGVLSVTLMDEDSLGSDEKLGVVSEAVELIRVGETRALALPFRNGEMGVVRVKITGMARP